MNRWRDIAHDERLTAAEIGLLVWVMVSEDFSVSSTALTGRFGNRKSILKRLNRLREFGYITLIRGFGSAVSWRAARHTDVQPVDFVHESKNYLHGAHESKNYLHGDAVQPVDYHGLVQMNHPLESSQPIDFVHESKNYPHTRAPAHARASILREDLIHTVLNSSSVLSREVKKERKDKKKEKFEPRSALIPDFIPVTLWQDWCDHRDLIGKPLSHLAVVRCCNSLKSIYDKSGQAGVEASIDASIERGWSGIFEQQKRGNGNGKGIDIYNTDW